MRLRAAFAFAALISGLVPAPALARGEASFALPEARVEPAASSVRSPAQPVWSHYIDPPASGDALAIGSGVVAFASEGRMCGYDDATGATVWCAGNGIAPAYASGVVAYAGADRSVRAVDARTGTLRWRRDGADRVWPSGGAFVVATKNVEDHDAGFSSVIHGIAANGRMLWSASLSANGLETTVTPDYMVWRWANAGATTTISSAVVAAGFSKGVLGSVGGDVLDVRPPLIFADTTSNEIEEVQDHFLVFNVAVFDVAKNGYIGQYAYAPDYDANLALWNNNCCVGESSGGKIHIGGDDVYIVVHKSVYRYQLGPATWQRPLRVATDAAFLGGPYRGTLYVQRAGAIWALHPGASAITAQPVLRSNVVAQAFSIANDFGLAIFQNGEVRGFDVTTGRETFAAAPCARATPTPLPPGLAPTNYIPIRATATRKRIFIACSSGGYWMLYAYAR